MSESKVESQQPDLREENTITLFNAIYGNIQFIKRQQWQLVYYTLLLQGALVYIRMNSTISPRVFIVLTWLISGVSFYLLYQFIKNLRKERKVIAPLRSMCFIPKVFDILYLKYPEKLTCKELEKEIVGESNKKDWEYLIVFGLLYLFTSFIITLFAFEITKS